jgi:DNA polymerase III delta prime subunit
MHARGTLEAVQHVCRQCHYSPRQRENWQPVRFHLVLIDEADQMSNAAQLALLSKLDATAFPPNTIFIFTCNANG